MQSSRKMKQKIRLAEPEQQQASKLMMLLFSVHRRFVGNVTARCLTYTF